MDERTVQTLEHCRAMLLGCFVLGVVIVGGVYGVHQAWHGFRLMFFAGKCQASVSDVVQDYEEGGEGSRGGYVHDFTYSFRGPDGRLVKGRARCGEEPPAAVITVEYDRGDPRNCRIDDVTWFSRYLSPCLVLAFTVWALGVTLSWCARSIADSGLALLCVGRWPSVARALLSMRNRAASVMSTFLLFGDFRNTDPLRDPGPPHPSEASPAIGRLALPALIPPCAVEFALGLAVGLYATDSHLAVPFLPLGVIGVGCYAGVHVAHVVLQGRVEKAQL